MQSTIYFWKNNQTHIYKGHSDVKSIKRTDFMNCVAVDLECIEEMRHGKYTELGWEHIPIHQFPKEFRTHLLLLGVT